MNNRAVLVQSNFHTHTYRCMHASGTDEQMVQAAIKEGFRVLGFSDHSPWKYGSDFVARMRMTTGQFAEYATSVRTLQEKYKDKVEILLGLEAEYFPDYMDWFVDFLIKEKVDYVILGQHYHGSDEYGVYFGRADRSLFETYIDDCIRGLETGIYSYLAHPDLPLRGMDWDEGMRPGFERLCKYCADHDIPLEYNVLGMQVGRKMGHEGYPSDRFWKIAEKYRCQAIIGMDAHRTRDLDRRLYDRARKRLERYDVQIVDSIRRVDFRALKEER